MSDETVNIVNGGVEQEASLAEIADLDITNLEAAFGGFTKTPPSVALWVVENMELVATKKSNPMVSIECKCVKPYAINDDSMQLEDMVDFKHIERIVVKDANEDMKKVVGFLQMIGIETSGKLSELMDRATGIAFVAVIKHSKNKDDPENPYVNMDIKGIKSQADYEALAA